MIVIDSLVETKDDHEAAVVVVMENLVLLNLMLVLNVGIIGAMEIKLDAAYRLAPITSNRETSQPGPDDDR